MALVSGFVRSSIVIELCHALLRDVLEPGARVVESMTDEPPQQNAFRHARTKIIGKHSVLSLLGLVPGSSWR